MAAISRANYGKRVGLLDAKIQTIGLFRVTWKKRHNVLPLHSIKNRARNKIPTLKGKCRNQRNPSGLRAYGTGEEQVGCRVWESASAHSAGVESSGASVVYGDGQLGSNGRLIHPLNDTWIPSLDPLAAHIKDELSPPSFDSLSGLLNDNGQWDQDKLSAIFRPKAIQHILGVKCPDPLDRDDCIVWRWMPKHNFETQSAYSHVAETTWDPKSTAWKHIWRAPIPQCLRVFLWTSFKKKLMTNLKRYRRFISNSALCSLCNVTDKSTLNILRDCVVARKKSRTDFVFNDLMPSLESTTGRAITWARYYAHIKKYNSSFVRLEVAWAQGVVLLELQSDCAEAVKMVNSPNAERSSLPLVWGTARLRKRSWITNIHWIPRGSNQPADTLAKIVAPNSHDVVHLQSSPQALLPLLHEDTSTIPAITA
ncbi:hypothetical protein V6N12_007642 [Hibiscus sabdariffa]|uniref:Reverse transcriptase zinc-binding domain-containing protein n=1 Tax=Hibiscus sabdariffa TaxID=183260 RepID=A0ABR2F2D3_9ROSI